MVRASWRRNLALRIFLFTPLLPFHPAHRLVTGRECFEGPGLGSAGASPWECVQSAWTRGKSSCQSCCAGKSRGEATFGLEAGPDVLLTPAADGLDGSGLEGLGDHVGGDLADEGAQAEDQAGEA